MLFAYYDTKSNTASRRWEQDISLDLSEPEWENIYTYIHKGTVNIHTQENRFKFFSRWYRPPLKLQNISPTSPFQCWRCGEELRSLLHIWWSCSQIQPFWIEVHRLTIKITTFALEYSPAQFLLHH